MTSKKAKGLAKCGAAVALVLAAAFAVFVYSEHLKTLYCVLTRLFFVASVVYVLAHPEVLNGKDGDS